MKAGDIVKIRNAAGILTVKLEKELSLQDVTRGIGDDKIPELKNPRFEVHRGRCGGYIVTLCGDCSSFPFNMWVMHIEDYCDPQVFLGVCDDSEAEEMIFETVT